MVTLGDARKIITAAEKKAKELRQPMNIAVADGGGNLVAKVIRNSLSIRTACSRLQPEHTAAAKMTREPLWRVKCNRHAERLKSAGQVLGLRSS